MTGPNTRRSFLAAAGAGALAVGSWTALGQRAGSPDVRLAMTGDGWVGRAPDAISGKASPTLALRPNQSYVLQWENRTSGRHNLVLTPSYPDGKAIVRSDFLAPGETQTVAFTAAPELSAYFCEVHREEMGPVTVGSGGLAGANATNATGNRSQNASALADEAWALHANLTGGNATDNASNATGNASPGAAGGDLAGSSPEPAQTFKLIGSRPGWQGLAPRSIQGETNPTLPLQPGETYDVMWVNGDGAPHNFMIETNDDEQLVRSAVLTQSGNWETVRFVATGRMYQYYCQYHPLAMRGDVELSGAGTVVETGANASNATETNATEADATGGNATGENASGTNATGSPNATEPNATAGSPSNGTSDSGPNG